MFIEEFLYRGNETAKPDDDTWHVVLAEWVTDAVNGGRRLVKTEPLNPSQAAQRGFTLDKILKGLNQRALESVETMREEREKMREQRDASRSEASMARRAAEATHARAVAALKPLGLAAALDTPEEPR